jgi:general transcriptional corepressor TUP1
VSHNVGECAICLLLCVTAEDKTVKVWDITHKRILHTFTGHEHGICWFSYCNNAIDNTDIYSLDFSQDGRFIVSGSGDKKAKIWDIEKAYLLLLLLLGRISCGWAK